MVTILLNVRNMAISIEDATRHIVFDISQFITQI
jgi:hypothetical protein